MDPTSRWEPADHVWRPASHSVRSRNNSRVQRLGVLLICATVGRGNFSTCPVVMVSITFWLLFHLDGVGWLAAILLRRRKQGSETHMIVSNQMSAWFLLLL